MQHCSPLNFEAAQPLFHSLFNESDTNVERRKCKSFVKMMLEKCKEEQCLQAPPLDDYVQRVSYYTGLPSTYLTHLETENTPTMPPKVVDLIVILNCLKQAYNNQRYPSSKEFYAAVLLYRQGNDMEVISYDQFCHQMISLHICERPTKNSKYLLMEDPKITFERYNYLKKFEKYRNKETPVYYLDERIIMEPRSSNGDQEFLFYAVMMNNGYVRGLYCTNPDKDVYMKWIVDILIPLLNPSSLIIISEGPFNKTADNNITRYHSKAEMLKWLTTKNIPCSDSMHKAELYDLISKCTLKSEQSNIEQVLKAYGYEVLFRPAYLKECTPTEAFWSDLHSELSLESVKICNPNLQGKIETYINSVTQVQWILYERLVAKQEQLLLSLDKEIQEALENYEFDTVACENSSIGYK